MALAVTRVILRCEEAQETQVLGITLLINCLVTPCNFYTNNADDVTVFGARFSSNNRYLEQNSCYLCNLCCKFVNDAMNYFLD